MGSIYIQNKSPFYWIRFYDRHEPDPKKRRKSLNTKIPISPEGKQKAQILLKKFELGLAERDIFQSSGADNRVIKSLWEGLEDYISTKQIKAGTLELYNRALNLLVKATNKNQIAFVTNGDYKKLRTHMDESGLSYTSQSIYLRHLFTLFSFWEKENFIERNPIIKLKVKKRPPQPIDLDDLQAILKHFKEKEAHPHHHQFVLTQLLTGWRPSTTLELKWSDIHFEEKYIRAFNVKADHEFIFPLHKQLEDLIQTIKKTGEKVFPFKGKDSLKFWSRDIKKLEETGEIKRYYKLYQLRSTFASITASATDIQNVQTMLDHSNSTVTKDHYVNIKTSKLREILDDVFVSK